MGLSETFENETWKEIPGYEGEYAASSMGRVKSLARSINLANRWGPCVRTIPERLLKQRKLSGSPYPTVCLSQGGSHQNQYVHSLICSAFHGPRPSDRQTAHGDGNPENNAPGNLRWATVGENAKDRKSHCTQAMGETSFAKLTESDVAYIRRARLSGVSRHSLAKTFGVSGSQIYRVTTGKAWAHSHGRLS